MSDIFFDATWPKARKGHDCDQCSRTIERGETYRAQSMIWDGRPSRSKICAQCAKFAEALFKVGFENEEGGWAWLPEVDRDEAAYCGFSVQMDLFWAKWRNSVGVLVEYPAHEVTL